MRTPARFSPSLRLGRRARRAADPPPTKPSTTAHLRRAVQGDHPMDVHEAPRPWARHAVAARCRADALTFEMGVSGVKGRRGRGWAFQIHRTVQDRRPRQPPARVLPPTDSRRPGVVVGTNDAATWAPGPTASTVGIVLYDRRWLEEHFKGGLHPARRVNGGRTFFFQPQLQTSRWRSRRRAALAPTCDLPLPGRQLLRELTVRAPTRRGAAAARDRPSASSGGAGSPAGASHGGAAGDADPRGFAPRGSDAPLRSTSTRR